MTLKSILSLVLSCHFLCFWAAMRWPDLLCYHHPPPIMMFCLATGPIVMRSSNYGLKPLKPWAKINISSFQVVFYQFFITMMKNWLTQCFLAKAPSKSYYAIPILHPMAIQCPLSEKGSHGYLCLQIPTSR
jgi:hypothetical protein